MKKRIVAGLLALVLAFLVCGCKNAQRRSFQNVYDVPETLSPYTRIETRAKTDWTAQYIWDASDGSEENVWMCFRKHVALKTVPADLTAQISADSKYWLYINGTPVVFEGGVKRGPTPGGSYYDSVPISSFLKEGQNVICALVWYWGKDTSYSSTDSGKAGFLFEAGEIVSDSSWKVCRNAAYENDPGRKKPNYRLPESNIYYDARKEPGDWTSPAFDDSTWEAATQNGTGGCAPWGELVPRGIPLLKDSGLQPYENADAYSGATFSSRTKLTLDIPYNAQCTPYLKIDAPAGKIIRITTENTSIGAVRSTYITRDGEQEFEALGWFNGAHIRYEIPAGVTVLSLKYRETGYDTAFAGAFACENEALNTLWQKSLRTLYVTMRDSFMDCPDRERAQWWGDVTSEMAMSMYALDARALLLYQKGVASMLGHIDPNTKVLQTVVPCSGDFFELPVQQLAGVCGFWTYYLYTGDRAFLETVYDAAAEYVGLWEIGDDDLVRHREGSWDWMDWGLFADDAAIENAWYYHALSCLCSMADVLGKSSQTFRQNMERIRHGYASLWTKHGFKSKGLFPDDRANALAVIAGLATPDQYDVLTKVLTKTKNASPYMEYYVLEALCQMGRSDLAKARTLQRYGRMIREDYSTLWELWIRIGGTRNHAWSGGPLVIMSKYFAGIRPLEPGWNRCEIRPQTDVCAQITCTVPTVRGYIRLNTEKTEGALRLDAQVPQGTTAVLYIPYTDGQTLRCNGSVVYENGRPTGTQDLTFTGAEDGCLIYTLHAAAGQTVRFEAGNG